jgi:hypothetical protein
MVNYTDSQTASVTSVAGTQTTISTFNVPQGQAGSLPIYGVVEIQEHTV